MNHPARGKSRLFQTRGDTDTYVGSGITLQRDGRFVRMARTGSPEQPAEMLRGLGESAPSIRDKMNCKVDALYKVLQLYKPECVVSALWLRNVQLGFAGERLGRCPTNDQVLAYVEYVATLYLIDPSDGRNQNV